MWVTELGFPGYQVTALVREDTQEILQELQLHRRVAVMPQPMPQPQANVQAERV